MVSPEVLTKISNGVSDENGRHCYFYRMSETRGLKTYAWREQRDEAYYAQLLCWMFGLGPEPFEVFTLELAESVYCYVTEIIECLDEQPTFDDERDCPVKKAYKEINAHINDICGFNLGKMGEKVVMLDFGDVKFGEYCERLKNEADLERWYIKLTEEQC